MTPNANSLNFDPDTVQFTALDPNGGLADWSEGTIVALGDSSQFFPDSTTPDSMWRLGIDLINSYTTRRGDTTVEIWDMWRYNTMQDEIWIGSWEVVFKQYNKGPDRSIFEVPSDTGGRR